MYLSIGFVPQIAPIYTIPQIFLFYQKNNKKPRIFCGAYVLVDHESHYQEHHCRCAGTHNAVWRLCDGVIEVIASCSCRRDDRSV